MTKFLPWLAMLLLTVWIIARLTVAITGFLLQLLWILSLVLFCCWLLAKVLNKRK
jgi:flagellar biogenesis protein FliO